MRKRKRWSIGDGKKKSAVFSFLAGVFFFRGGNFFCRGSTRGWVPNLAMELGEINGADQVLLTTQIADKKLG